MLKKLVLLVVALFSIATEMRMLVQFGKQKSESYLASALQSHTNSAAILPKKDDLMKWSELWHAQSVFFGAYYLPQTCPLVTHVANSYNKHYILSKPQQPQKPSIVKGDGIQVATGKKPNGAVQQILTLDSAQLQASVKQAIEGVIQKRN